MKGPIHVEWSERWGTWTIETDDGSTVWDRGSKQSATAKAQTIVENRNYPGYILYNKDGTVDRYWENRYYDPPRGMAEGAYGDSESWYDEFANWAEAFVR